MEHPLRSTRSTLRGSGLEGELEKIFKRQISEYVIGKVDDILSIKKLASMLEHYLGTKVDSNTNQTSAMFLAYSFFVIYRTQHDWSKIMGLPEEMKLLNLMTKDIIQCIKINGNKDYNSVANNLFRNTVSLPNGVVCGDYILGLNHKNLIILLTAMYNVMKNKKNAVSESLNL